MIRSVWLALALAFTLSAQAPIHLTIHAKGGNQTSIPPTVFGTFLEPIGNSTYNGLWAEILQNPSFESGLWSASALREMLAADPQLMYASQLALPVPWEPLYENQGNRYEPRRGDAANSFESIAVLGLPGGEVGVRQRVYLPVHRVLEYRGSIYVKHLGGPDVMRVSIRKRDHPDQILSTAEIRASSAEWKKYTFVVTLKPGQLKPLEPADFVLSTGSDQRMLIDNASLMPADAEGGLDPDMISAAKEIHTPLVRFGGNFTSAYHWRDGIGPEEKRISVRNVAWGIPETNQFGTDEFLRFCKMIGAQPQIALNLGTGTPEEAAEWVRYVNEHWTSHSGLLWELGNELWGNWNAGYPTLSELATRTRRFSEAIRKADPAARLIATGQDPDNYEKWNAAQLTSPAGTFDFLSTHFVVTTDRIAGPEHSGESIALDTFALPVGLERKLHEMKKQIDAAGQRNLAIAFTEWLFHCCRDNRNDAPRFDNFGGAIAAASFLNMLLRNADIVPVADMTGIIEFGGIWKKRSRVYVTPAYHAFKMFSTADPKFALPVDSDSPRYDVHRGITRIPEIPNVPYLDAVAVRDLDGRVTLFCVNRNVNQDLEAEIAIDGFAPKGLAQVQELFASSLYVRNDEMRPGAVRPIESTVPTNRGRLHFTFRHASVTRIDLSGK